MGFWIFGKKKKEAPEFPFHYLKIVYNKNAVYNGVFDDFQKEIRRIKEGEVVEIIPYSKEEVIALIKTFSIPVVDETKLKDEEDFEFEEMISLTGQFLEGREE